MINTALAFYFKEARLATTGRSDLEHINYVGHVRTIMRFSTSKGGDLSSCFDKTGESALKDNNLLKRILINNHIDDNKGKYKGGLELEHNFGFCKLFKKRIKNLAFQLTFKTANLQDIILTATATDINVTVSNFYLYVPILIPKTHTKIYYEELHNYF